MKLRFDIKPLTVNQSYTGQRFKTAAYKQYIKDIGNLLLFQKKNIENMEGLLMIHCKFYFKSWKRPDADNPIKPVLDCLVKMGIIKDDRYIMRVISDKIPSNKDYIEIEIHPFDSSKLR